jgi:hypothetical protein
MEDDLRFKDDIKVCRIWLHKSQYEFFGEIRVKLRGNLECGSAQPSLSPNFPLRSHNPNNGCWDMQLLIIWGCFLFEVIFILRISKIWLDHLGLSLKFEYDPIRPRYFNSESPVTPPFPKNINQKQMHIIINYQPILTPPPPLILDFTLSLCNFK